MPSASSPEPAAPSPARPVPSGPDGSRPETTAPATISSSDERFTMSPSTYRTVAAVALALLCTIVVTGAAVRLSGSGLGCSDWPNCSQEGVVQFGDTNQTIEQVNRLFTGLVSLAVVTAVLGSIRRRPYRRDLVWLSWGLVAGVVGQIVLGGITVLVHLHPVAVGGHFVLSMILVADGLVLLWRAGQPDGDRAVRVPRPDLLASRAAVALMVALMFTGPAVTGTGPHAGDASSHRFGWFLPDVVRVHSVNMWIFLAVVVVVLFRLARSGAPGDVMRRGYRLLVVIVAQGAIGYTQYELGIPPWLVALHIAGATAVLCLTIWFHLGLSGPAAERNPASPTVGADTAETSAVTAGNSNATESA